MLGAHHERLKGMIELAVFYVLLVLSHLDPVQGPFGVFLIQSHVSPILEVGLLCDLLELVGAVVNNLQVLNDVVFELSKSLLVAQSVESVQCKRPNNVSVRHQAIVRNAVGIVVCC